MSLRGHILQSVSDWRFERAMRQFERMQAKKRKDPRWTRFDELMNFTQFICLVIFAASMSWIALSYATRAYPEAVYIAIKTIGLTN